jgi:hypothetical protein
VSKFAIVHRGRESAEEFSNYVFDVVCDGRKVAELSHDYKGDEHWIRLPGESWATLAERVIQGGGPQPLQLSAAGVRAVERLIGS